MDYLPHIKHLKQQSKPTYNPLCLMIFIPFFVAKSLTLQQTTKETPHISKKQFSLTTKGRGRGRSYNSCRFPSLGHGRFDRANCNAR